MTDGTATRMIIRLELFDRFNMIEFARWIKVGDVPLTVQILCHRHSDVDQSSPIFFLRLSLLRLKQTNPP